MAKLTKSEKLSKIITLESEITSAVFKGHKPDSNDKFKKHRKMLDKLRKELNLVRNAQ